MCRDNCILPRPGVTKIELARRPKESEYKEIGLGKYAIGKIVEIFELVPRTLAENAGLNATEIISSLYTEYAYVLS